VSKDGEAHSVFSVEVSLCISLAAVVAAPWCLVWIVVGLLCLVFWRAKQNQSLTHATLQAKYGPLRGQGQPPGQKPNRPRLAEKLTQRSHRSRAVAPRFPSETATPGFLETRWIKNIETPDRGSSHPTIHAKGEGL
jgi:hypothetical protein